MVSSSILRHIRSQNLTLNGSRLTAVRSISDHLDNQISNRLSNGHSIVRREFSLLTDLSQKFNGRNQELQQSFNEFKERSEGLKDMKVGLNARTTNLTRNVMFKHVDRVMMGSEGKAKVKESYGLARNYSTESNGIPKTGDGLKGVKPDDMKKGSDTVTRNEMNLVSSLRPLSPHLSIYKPQETSLSSISFRISGIVLVTAVLGFYLVYMKLGLISFTSESVYLLMLYLAKLIPISAMLLAVALTYHVYHGVPHILPWFTRFKKT